MNKIPDQNKEANVNRGLLIKVILLFPPSNHLFFSVFSIVNPVGKKETGVKLGTAANFTYCLAYIKAKSNETFKCNAWDTDTEILMLVVVSWQEILYPLLPQLPLRFWLCHSSHWQHCRTLVHVWGRKVAPGVCIWSESHSMKLEPYTTTGTHTGIKRNKDAEYIRLQLPVIFSFRQKHVQHAHATFSSHAPADLLTFNNCFS